MSRFRKEGVVDVFVAGRCACLRAFRDAVALVFFGVFTNRTIARHFRS